MEQQTMQVTNVRNSLNGSSESLNVTFIPCTEIMTFTEVLEEEEWESLYYSFKVFVFSCLHMLYVSSRCSATKQI